MCHLPQAKARATGDERAAEERAMELHDGRLFVTRKLAELTAILPHLG